MAGPAPVPSPLAPARARQRSPSPARGPVRSARRRCRCARPRHAVHVVNVIETDAWAGEDTASLRPALRRTHCLMPASPSFARRVSSQRRAPHSDGTHIDVARQILRRAADLRAGAIVLGPDTHQALANDVSAYVAGQARPMPRGRHQPPRRRPRPASAGGDARELTPALEDRSARAQAVERDDRGCGRPAGVRAGIVAIPPIIRTTS